MATYEIKVTHLSGSRRSAVETFSLLPQRPLKIGRGDDCQLRFDPEADRQVSALHAEIMAGDAGPVLKDLGSKNGLTLNGQRVEGEVALPNHGVVEVGLGGPRLQVVYEAGGGINFNQLRKQETSKVQFRPMATTDDALPVQQHASDLGEEGGGGRAPALVGAAVLALLALGGLLYWLLGAR